MGNKLMDLQFFRLNNYMPKPLIIQIEITQKCPLNCKQCYKSEQNKEMSFEMLSHYLYEIKELKIKQIVLNGGEPFVYPYIIDTLKLIENLNLKATIFTSGCGIRNKIINQLKNSKNINIGLSFNGSTSVIHNFSRDRFDITYNVANIFKKNEINYFINWVARHDNVRDLPNLIELSKKISASFINVVANKLTGFGELDSELEIDDYIYLREIILTNREYCSIQNCYNTLQVFCYNSIKSQLVGCAAGKSFCCISVDGCFMPCTHINVKEKFSSILDYWINSIELSKLRKSYKRRGGLCEMCQRSEVCNPCRAMDTDLNKNYDLGLKNCINFKGK